VPKRKRKDQHHLGQESQRKRGYTGGTNPQGAVFKPGFPMNLFGNLKLFSIIGIAIAVIMVVSAVIASTQSNSNPTSNNNPTPTITPTPDPNATPTPGASATATALSFPSATQIVDSTHDYRAIVKTSMGDITINLDADVAPNTVNSFIFLAQNHFFDGITFHRVVANFVIQSGDPTGTGTGGPGYTTQDEPNTVPNKRGTVSMAKTQGADDFGSQWFINMKDNPSLDFNNSGGDKFYPFGTVDPASMSVVDAIGKVPTDATGKPTTPVTINSVVIETSNK
jgi:cyclophilin family peptidyl-prolyl cis-trans isomerase